MSFVVLCDFDGTSVNVDTCVYILNKFAETDWRTLDEQLEKGQITLEECLQKQFSSVSASAERVVMEVQQVASIRPYFEELVKFCMAHKFPLILVSAGLDFVITSFLEQIKWGSFVKIYSPKVECTGRGIRFTFPKLLNKTSVNFKDDLVISCQRQGRKVVYIGDGLSDYYAAKNADFSFAIKGSKLAELLKRNKVSYQEIDGFKKVVDFLQSECVSPLNSSHVEQFFC